VSLVWCEISNQYKGNKGDKMNTQPEALRLAELLEMDGWFPTVAAELRRLHEVNQMLVNALDIALEVGTYSHDDENKLINELTKAKHLLHKAKENEQNITVGTLISSENT
jgi:hypothetical protein